MEALEDQLEEPIYRSILFPPTVGGIPRKLLVIILILNLLVVFSWGQVWFLAVGISMYSLARIVCSKDKFAYEITVELMSIPDYMS